MTDGKYEGQKCIALRNNGAGPVLSGSYYDFPGTKLPDFERGRF